MTLREPPAQLDSQIATLVDEYVEPAFDGLRTAVREDDREALRAYAYELAMLAGTLLRASRRRRQPCGSVVSLPLDRPGRRPADPRRGEPG